MKRLVPAALLSAALAWALARPEPAAPPAVKVQAPAPNRPRPSSPPVPAEPGAEPGALRHARQDRFEANLGALDVAIALAEEAGGDPDYLAALRRRRELIADQAEAEAEVAG